MNQLKQRLAEAGRAITANATSRDLRRAQLSFGAAWAAEWAFTVVIGVVAFREGGAVAVGLVALLRLAPAALVGPLGATIADRLPRDRVLVAVGMFRAVALGGCAAVVAMDGPLPLLYLLAILQTVAFTVFRPTHSALLPALCQTPFELTSANVVRGLLDSFSVLVGPLAAALLLDLSGAASVFVAAALASLWSAWLVLRLRYERAQPVTGPRPHLLRQVAVGVRAIVAQRDVLLVTCLILIQAFTRGCFTVLVVVVSFDVLNTGEPGVGTLTAAVGVGAVIGSLGAFLLVGGHGLAVLLGVGVTLWGLPIAVAGLLSSEPLVALTFAIIGIGNALVDVGAFTLFARLVPDAVLARVFGVLEGAGTLAVGVGSILTPVVINAIGTTGAMIVLGLVGPAAAALSWPRLRRLDEQVARGDEEIEILRRVDMLRLLPMPAIGLLALNAERVRVKSRDAVFREGDHGDQFYVIVDGQAEVTQDGTRLRSLGPGAGFGEIALLRDTVRTATVTADTDLSLCVLDRRHFVPAVTGYRGSLAEADRVIDERLGPFRG